MSTSSVLLSQKLAATLAEAVTILELVNKVVDHEGWKLLQAEEDEVKALKQELEELEQARKEAVNIARLERRAEKTRLLIESGHEDDAPVSDEAMQELEDAKKQLDLDRWNFENDKFQLEVLQAQLGGADSVSFADKSLMIPAREVKIVFGDKPDHWKWTSVPETRYAVAELMETNFYQMYARLSPSRLFPYTKYAAYFIFKLTEDAYGFDISTAEAGTGLRNKLVNNIYLVAEEDQAGPERAHYYPKARADGWMEVELGSFFVEGDEDDEIQISLLEIWSGNLRKGLIVLGFELRPKLNKKKCLRPCSL